MLVEPGPMQILRSLDRVARAALLLCLVPHVGGCSGKRVPSKPEPPVGCSFAPAGAASAQKSQPLRINEVMTGNDGAWVDESGETDDFVELINTGDQPVRLDQYSLADRVGQATVLPALELAAGATILLWADSDPEQGELHMPFKLASSGTQVLLWANSCELVDSVEVPVLPRSESYARLPDGSGDFEVCRYATPERINGTTCQPPPPPNLGDDTKFAPYSWQTPFPIVSGPLVLSELALRPAGFVEVLNTSDAAVELEDFELRLAPMPPGKPWPEATAGFKIAWPTDTPLLAPGERLVVPVSSEATADLEATADFEGVLSLWQAGVASPSDRLNFMAWPAGAALARVPDASGAARFCKAASPGASNARCRKLDARELPSGRAHRLATAGDFARLAAGSTEVGEAGVKFVVDMQAGDVVHLLGTRDWALHYSWIREQIQHEPHLDRCDPEQSKTFNQGWAVFSQDEYYRSEGRRYLLGTLVQHKNGTKTVEFTPGDAIVGSQMKRAFFAVMNAVEDPTEWSIRPTEGRQIAELRTIEGLAPLVGPNAPYIGLTYQPLNPSVGFGTLQFVPAHELETAELGPNVIVVTDDVPNETAFVGGLITEAFQTPLAHVNVLARGRGTPNMALRGARSEPRLQGLFGKLVRLEVGASDFSIREASAAEADEYWQSRVPAGPKVTPVRDLSLRGVVSLSDVDYSAVASVGSKAAGIAELYRVSELAAFCPATSLPLFAPPDAFAIPFAHYVDHFRASGAEGRLTELEQDPEFRADPAAHAEGLASLRDLILKHPVDPELRDAVRSELLRRFGTAKVRFRSSSNTEDLPTFNGAGLHTSTTADTQGSSATVEDGLRTVWASLWNTRAYDEREFGHVDQSAAAMAILVHQAWREQAQGVAISRNALHATRDSQYYINAQIGEASVTNPAPGVTSDEIVYTPPPRRPKVDYQARSSLSRGRDVLSFAEIENLGCALASIHRHFQPLVDPEQTNRLYAMQIEWKLIGAEHQLLVKQARPYNFGAIDAPSDCREF